MLAFFVGSDIHQNPQELTRTHKKKSPDNGRTVYAHCRELS